MTDTAAQAAREAGEHPALEALARGGYAIHGFLHLVIAWIIVQIIVGGGGEASQSGALGQVRQAAFGQTLLWIGVAGYAGLALWQVLEAAVGYHPRKRPASLANRAKEFGKGVVYGALAWTTYTFASGGSTDSGQTTADFTTTLMQARWARRWCSPWGWGCSRSAPTTCGRGSPEASATTWPAMRTGIWAGR